jgi:hypothetical protein
MAKSIFSIRCIAIVVLVAIGLHMHDKQMLSNLQEACERQVASLLSITHQSSSQAREAKDET